MCEKFTILKHYSGSFPGLLRFLSVWYPLEACGYFSMFQFCTGINKIQPLPLIRFSYIGQTFQATFTIPPTPELDKDPDKKPQSAKAEYKMRNGPSYLSSRLDAAEIKNPFKGTIHEENRAAANFCTIHRPRPGSENADLDTKPIQNFHYNAKLSDILEYRKFDQGTKKEDIRRKRDTASTAHLTMRIGYEKASQLQHQRNTDRDPDTALARPGDVVEPGHSSNFTFMDNSPRARFKRRRGLSFQSGEFVQNGRLWWKSTSFQGGFPFKMFHQGGNDLQNL